MKIIIATVCVAALALAEPPPSNSYLPPPPAGRNGYSQNSQGQNFGAGPEIVAARNLGVEHGSRGNHGVGGAPGHFGARDNHDNDVHSNGFSRNAPRGRGGSQASFGGADQGYDQNAGSLERNAYDEANAEPANYNFGYMVNDYQEGTAFGHREERQEKHAQGEYHVLLPDGKKQTVNYEADERGFKPQISYEDTDARSGYDSNAQPNFRANGGRGNHGSARSGGY